MSMPPPIGCPNGCQSDLSMALVTLFLSEKIVYQSRWLFKQHDRQTGRWASSFGEGNLRISANAIANAHREWRFRDQAEKV
jgi:hypothetical protein